MIIDEKIAQLRKDNADLHDSNLFAEKCAPLVKYINSNTVDSYDFDRYLASLNTSTGTDHDFDRYLASLNTSTGTDHDYKQNLYDLPPPPPYHYSHKYSTCTKEGTTPLPRVNMLVRTPNCPQQYVRGDGRFKFHDSKLMRNLNVTHITSPRGSLKTKRKVLEEKIKAEISKQQHSYVFKKQLAKKFNIHPSVIDRYNGKLGHTHPQTKIKLEDFRRVKENHPGWTQQQLADFFVVSQFTISSMNSRLRKSQQSNY
jgi:hypothetical protein